MPQKTRKVRKAQNSIASYYHEMWKVSWKKTNDLFGLKIQIIQLTLILLVLIISAIRLRETSISFDITSLEVIWNGFWPNIVGLIILILISPIVTLLELFWVIPEEYRNRQKEIVSLERRLTSDVIDANVTLIPFVLISDRVSALLKVKNGEQSKKITSCRAKLTRFFMTCDKEGRIIDFTDSISAMEFPFFYWQENHDKQIDIDHSDEKILCIAASKEYNFLELAVLRDENKFPAQITATGKKFYEIRFKVELSGIIGSKSQVFYKTFVGKVNYIVTPIFDMGENIMVNDITFIEANDKDLVESLDN